MEKVLKTKKRKCVQTFDWKCIYMPVLHSISLSLRVALPFILPVGDVFHVADGIINASFLGAQDDSVEVSVHHCGAETFELRNQPAKGMRRNR